MVDNKIKIIFTLGIVILFVSAGSIPSHCVTNIPNQILSRGDPYFIMLSDYTDGAGDENLWALQLRFDINLGIVESEFDNKSLTLITDKWVEIKINIDLNNDWMKIYYDGDLLHQKQWTAGPDNQGNGILNISAINLFSDSQDSVYFDDFSLEEVGGGIIWEEDFDTYEDKSSIHGQGGWKGWDNNSDYTAYVSSFKNHSSLHSLNITYGSDLIHEYFSNYSGEFVYTAWIYFPKNNAPFPPEITGPESGGVEQYYEYSFVATDPDFDELWYYVDWGDGGFEDWIGPFASGEEVTIVHNWSDPGEYEIKAKARDVLDFESSWSEPLNVTISRPPDAPDIYGPKSVKVNVYHEFTFHTIDPDGDDVKYFIDWGNNETQETVFYFSGKNISINNSWAEKGNYTIKAKAVDVYNAESAYSTFEIIVPKNREFYLRFNLLSCLFERFLDAFQMLVRMLHIVR